MRKLVISGIAALIAATSFATAADAGHKWRKHGWHKGHHAAWHHRGWKRHHGWRHGGWRHRGWRAGVWIGGPRIVIGTRCVVRKHINRNGWVVKRRYC
jgi:Ni/Co efflux regulator RcnB